MPVVWKHITQQLKLGYLTAKYYWSESLTVEEPDSYVVYGLNWG